MEKWEQDHQAIMGILEQHFGACPAYHEAENLEAKGEDMPNWRKGQAPFNSMSQLEEMAQGIIDSADSAKGTIFIFKHDTSPGEDIKAIREAASHMQRAADKIGGVGWVGAEELYRITTDCFKPNHNAYSNWWSEDGINPILTLQRALSDISIALDAAAKQINPSERSVAERISETNEPMKKAPKSASVAFYTARECGEVYFQLTGKKPAFGNNPDTGQGPFARFVTDVFTTLQINHNVEYAAKNALKGLSFEK